MRFLADMGISRIVVQALRDLSHEATHLSETRQQRLPDDSIIEEARRENRIILTHDLDFSRLLSLGDDAKPSAITFRLSDMRSGNVIAHLLPALQLFETELEDGALVTVSDHASRCKKLPIYRQSQQPPAEQVA